MAGLKQYTQPQIDAYMGHLSEKGYKPEDVAAYREHLETNFGPQAKGFSADTPVDQPVLTDWNRVRAGFGDEAGIEDMVKAAGFTNVHKNKNGEVVAQDASGKWVKDATNFFPENPKREHDFGVHGANAGHAFGPAGQLIGAAAGELAGKLTGSWKSAHPANWAESSLGGVLPAAGMITGGALGTASPVPGGGVAGAGAGAAAGESLRDAIGRYLGSYHGDNAQLILDAAKEGAKGSAMELGGKVINKIPLGWATEYPNVGAAMEAATNWGMDKARRGVAWASGKMSGVPVDSVERLLERPTQVMHPMEPEAIADLGSQEMRARRKELGRKVHEANDNFFNQRGRDAADTSTPVSFGENFRNQIPLNEFGEGRLSAQEINNMVDWERDHLMTPVQSFERAPTKTFESLRGTADSLSRDIEAWRNANDFGTPMPPDIAYKQNMLGRIKGIFHEADPTGMGATDPAYADIMHDRWVMKRLGSPTGRESFIDNMMGKNKTAVQDAAARSMPETFNGPVQDLSASKDFNQGGITAGKWPTFRQGVRGALGGAASYQGSHSLGLGPMESAGLGATVLAATDPAFHKYVLGTASKISAPLTDFIREQGGGQIAPLMLRENPWLPKGE